MVSLRLTLLGVFRMETGMEPLSLPTKAQALPAYLALAPGQSHSRAKLAGLLWGDRGEEQARNSLRQALFVIRQPLAAAGRECLAIGTDTVKLDLTTIDVDVVAFRRLATQGTTGALQEAAALYGGDLLEGLNVPEATFERWLMAERTRLHELALTVLGQLLARQVDTGAPEEGIETALRVLALDPLQEPAHRALMRIHALQGRRGAALRQYQLCVDTLWRELRIEPEADTKHLYQEILQRGPLTPIEAGVRLASRDTALPAAREASAPGAPLVGRDAELDKLLARLRYAREGRSTLVVVLGEAGIGKTRLVEAVVAEGVRQGFRLVQGRAYESEQILPFGLWVNALRASGALADDELAEAVPPAWRRELGRLFPELHARDRAERPASENYLRLFEAIAQLVGCLAARGPLLLALEDLHWADQTSVRLLSFLGRRIARWPICIVVSAREEEADAQPLLRPVLDELAREAHLVEVPLAALSRADTIELVLALTAGPESRKVAELGERVWRMSEGNPLVVVEAVRSFHEDQAWTSEGDLPLPERVRRLVVERLGRTSDVAREVLDVASVIGRDFDFGVLQRASGLDERRAAIGVEELVRRRLLHQHGEHVDFTHDRVRETAYTALGAARRRLLHAAVAGALEQRYEDDLEPHAAALAVHHREAQAWDRAVSYLHAAGIQAVRRGAYREAQRLLEDSLEALAHLPTSRATVEQGVEIRIELRDVLVTLGDLGPVRDHLETAERMVEGLGDHCLWGRVFQKSAHYAWLIGDHDRAIALGHRILEWCQPGGDHEFETVAYFHIGQAYSVLGDHRRAVEALHRCVDASTHVAAFDHKTALGILPMIPKVWLGVSLAEMGEFTEGISVAEDAVAAAEAVQQLYTIAYTNLMLGSIHLGRGDLVRALPILERCHSLAESWQIGLIGPRSALALAQAYAAANRGPDAAVLLGPRPIPRRAQASMRLFRGAQGRLDIGQTAEALAVATQALELAREFRERGNEGHALRLLGDVHARQAPRDPRRAEECYRQGLALAEELCMRPLAAQCRLGLGELRMGGVPAAPSDGTSRTRRPTNGSERQASAAREHLDIAVREFRALAMPGWLARAEAALATLPMRPLGARS